MKSKLIRSKILSISENFFLNLISSEYPLDGLLILGFGQIGMVFIDAKIDNIHIINGIDWVKKLNKQHIIIIRLETIKHFLKVSQCCPPPTVLSDV